jgi:transcriptional regulator with XRE-family HTH domain
VGERRVPTNGRKAREARVGLRKTQEDIAGEAGVMPRVIINIEAGIGAVSDHIERVGKKLNLTYEDLTTLEPTELKTAESRTHGRLNSITIRVVLRIHTTDKGMALQAVAAMEARSQAENPIEVLGIEFSSIILRLRVSTGDAFRIIDAFGDGRLGYYNCESITISFLELAVLFPVAAIVAAPFIGLVAPVLLVLLARLRARLPKTLKITPVFPYHVLITKRDDEPTVTRTPHRPETTAWKDSYSSSSVRDSVPQSQR